MYRRVSQSLVAKYQPSGVHHKHSNTLPASSAEQLLPQPLNCTSVGLQCCAGHLNVCCCAAVLQVATEPLEVLGATARLRQVLQPHKGIHDTSKDTVENLSLVSGVLACGCGDVMYRSSVL